MNSILPALLLITVGGGMMWCDRRLILNGWRSKRWVKVRATVVDTESSSFVIDGANQFQGGRPVKYVECEWRYRYEWDGVMHEGNTYRFGGHVDQAIDGMEAGHQFMVYCNPERPSESVIHPGVGWFVYLETIMISAGIVFLMM